jgi:hypothetical protein
MMDIWESLTMLGEHELVRFEDCERSDVLME